MEVSSAILKRAAQSLRKLRIPLLLHISEERPHVLSHLCAGPQLAVPSPHLLLRHLPIATGLSGGGSLR